MDLVCQRTNGPNSRRVESNALLSIRLIYSHRYLKRTQRYVPSGRYELAYGIGERLDRAKESQRSDNTGEHVQKRVRDRKSGLAGSNTGSVENEVVCQASGQAVSERVWVTLTVTSIVMGLHVNAVTPRTPRSQHESRRAAYAALRGETLRRTASKSYSSHNQVM